jgi:hypothetical protein
MGGAMRPLTLDDLLPLEEFSSRRREFFDALQRYLDRYRRVRVGPRATLVFENRQTLWFRVQDVLRVARLAEPARLAEELELYNRLLPGKGVLQAALLLEIPALAPGASVSGDEISLPEQLAPWQGLEGAHLILRAGDACCPATLITCRPEDRCIGAAHWVQFAIDDACRRQLADLRRPAHVEITLPAYPHQSPALGDEVRQSLLEDLELSDRDAA